MKMLNSVVWKNLSPAEQAACLTRPAAGRNETIQATVAKILDDVRGGGDRAVLEYTNKFDCGHLKSLAVSSEEFSAAQIDESIRLALAEAIKRIRAFHQAQLPKPIQVETSKGVVCQKKFFPIERVALYVPGGTAPLPSTLMMLAIPASVAGCQDIVLVTPPNREGAVHPVILATAQILGIRKIFKCGGAQAIAAVAFGTQSIPKVDKIFGPGNAWVTEAKMQVAFAPGGAAIDLPAGPSEVMVIADESSSPVFVAADLLSQAEHDQASQVLLVSTSPALIEKVQCELGRQMADLPRRLICEKALSCSRAVLAADLVEAMEVANRYAPEHLILQTAGARGLAQGVRHAGSVFIGPWAPESVGDYASGTNHVLPTYGFARAFSGVGVDSFMKSISFQELTPSGLMEIGPTVMTLAEAEGLRAHRQAVSLRLDALKAGSS